jgi:hypothetical protein
MSYSYTYCFPTTIVKIEIDKKDHHLLQPIPRQYGEYKVRFSLRIHIESRSNDNTHKETPSTGLLRDIVQHIVEKIESESIRRGGWIYGETRPIGCSTLHISVFVTEISGSPPLQGCFTNLMSRGWKYLC